MEIIKLINCYTAKMRSKDGEDVYFSVIGKTLSDAISEANNVMTHYEEWELVEVSLSKE